LQRIFARELRPGERAATVEGVEGRRRHQVYPRWESPARNARWEGERKELPVLVIPPRGVRACKPWVTLFLDCYSRLIRVGRCHCGRTLPPCWPRRCEGGG
jgi:putative transposase